MEWLVGACACVSLIAAVLCVSVVMMARSISRSAEKKDVMIDRVLEKALAINQHELQRLEMELVHAHRPQQINPLPGEITPSRNREPVADPVLQSGVDAFGIDSRIG